MKLIALGTTQVETVPTPLHLMEGGIHLGFQRLRQIM